MSKYSFRVPSVIEYTMTSMELEIVNTLIECQKYVMAIKFLRCNYNLGLKEAKDWVDFIRGGGTGTPVF